MNVFGMENILSVALAFFVVTVSPGPANIAVATVAMSAGRKNGLLFGAGLSFGLACWGIVAATGMGAVLQGSVHLLFALKIFGGMYLLWLAFQSGRAALKKTVSVRNTPSKGRWFMRGLLLNLSNPKAVVAWMAALSMGMGSDAENDFIIIATAICIALGFFNYALHAMVFSLHGFMRGYQRSRRWIDGAVAGFFALAGFGLIRSALSR